MKDFKTRLYSAMQEKKISFAELSRRTGISKPRLSQYKNGVYVPKADAICAIAKALGISESYLMGNSDLPSAIGSARAKGKALPIIGEISCGYPIFANEEDDGFVTVDNSVDADFCLIAKGDSMKDARILNGDTVFIKKTDVVDNGDIAAVIINDEATLKRFYYYPESAKLVLLPENNNYEPQVYVGDDLEKIHILGKAVAFKSLIK